MARTSALTTIRERNKRKRLAGWILLYLLLILGFVFLMYWQTKRINTLNFARGMMQLTTSKTKYTVGDTVAYTLKNGLSQPITLLNSCPKEPLYVYSWTNNSWVRIHDTAGASTCNGESKQRTIAPGGSYTQSLANWPNLFSKPGIYRIVGLASNYTALPYADFQVVAKPVAPTVQVQTRTQIIIQKVITPIYITAPSSGSRSSEGD
ncbi:MAG TPA: hypothetical protein VMV24_02200 [Candidatus Dormibacteraeota bacterium]|nr:hypothetical protein [Candidatus Dormibacteraeota bacterium]